MSNTDANDKSVRLSLRSSKHLRITSDKQLPSVGFQIGGPVSHNWGRAEREDLADFWARFTSSAYRAARHMSDSQFDCGSYWSEHTQANLSA